MPDSAGGRPKLPDRPPDPSLHLEMFLEDFRLLDLHVVLSKRLSALEVLRCALVVSGFVERQCKIVMGFRGLGIGLFRFREVFLRHIPMSLAVMFDAGGNVTFGL